jgi:hypothetical protein
MESIESLQNERNLESDKALFVGAIEHGSVQDIETVFDEQVVQDLNDSIEKNKLFIMGETHGVKENADIIYTLFKKFGFRQLALEWEPTLKGVVDKYIESGELDFNTIKNSPDGRITAGHFILIKNLVDEGLLDKLICFDVGSGGGGWNTRDMAMAKSVIDNVSGVPTLVIAGRLHTKTAPFELGDDYGTRHPMGEVVSKEFPGVCSGKISYLSGKYHNYGSKEFAPSGEELTTNSKFFRNKDGLYIFELPKANIATVPHPSKRL